MSTETKTQGKVRSKDGTSIAYDRVGTGPAVILVDGALEHRAFPRGLSLLADQLAPRFTVYHYDRRGRGDSTDTQPYAVQKEIEDIEAIIDLAGGQAYLYGISSGAALAFEAALALGERVRKLALYEPPYNDDETARRAWRDYRKRLNEAIAGGQPGDALGTFMMLLGMP
jgi:pimeloyl-ACP methyl ester carboxylesterase